MIHQSTSNHARFAELSLLERLWTTFPPAMDWVVQLKIWAVVNLLPPGPDDAALLVNLLRTNQAFLQTSCVSTPSESGRRALISIHSSLLPTLARAPFAEAFWADLLGHLNSLSKEEHNPLPSNWGQLIADTLAGPWVSIFCLAGVITDNIQITQCHIWINK